MTTTAEPGWYDDGTGKQRWWDGARWTEHYVDLDAPELGIREDRVAPVPPERLSAHARAYQGVVIDGRWIHFAGRSQPVGRVVAFVATVGEIGKRPSLAHAVKARALLGQHGPMTPRAFGRLDRRMPCLVVESADQLWLAPLASPGDRGAQEFVAWVNHSADHYRFG